MSVTHHSSYLLGASKCFLMASCINSITLWWPLINCLASWGLNLHKRHDEKSMRIGYRKGTLLKNSAWQLFLFYICYLMSSVVFFYEQYKHIYLEQALQLQAHGNHFKLLSVPPSGKILKQMDYCALYYLRNFPGLGRPQLSSIVSRYQFSYTVQGAKLLS